MKVLKYLLIAVLVLLLLAALGLGTFIYKAKYGFNSYETTPHELKQEYGDQSILVISKTNAFRHGEAIDYSIPILKEIAEKNDWKIYCTEDAGIINEDQLKLFDLVICNNSTGKIMNLDQRKLFRSYIENGGGFLGIHGAGDDSHQWDWYRDTLIGARFSHHPIKYHIQKGSLHKETNPDTLITLDDNLPETFTAMDEWYVFFDSPRASGVEILYTLDETGLDWDGSLGPFFKDKIFGMGDDHPIVWYRKVGAGRSFYSAMGHDKSAWSNQTHQEIITEGIKWAGNFSN